ncbi:MAG TPA: cobalt ECF transporter T component CbiQ [Thermodesulfovibrionia bacterium]|nr:cobalt ECF transporter T component CbiQ [Thermodesulfovibrionia bacterium]
MFHEPFTEGESFLHNTDPRVKIIVALVFAIIVAMSGEPIVLGLAGLFVLLCFMLVKVDTTILVKRLLIVNLFIAFLSATLPFTTPGQTVVTFSVFNITKEGLELGATIFLKSNLVVMTSLFLLSTSSIFTLAHALHHLHVPGRLVQLLFFTFRYLHVIYLEYIKLTEAMKLRCFKAQTNWYTYRTLACMMGNLILKSYDRAERIYQAMLCRGFYGVFPTFYHFRLTRTDKVFGVFCSVFFLAMAALSFLW